MKATMTTRHKEQVRNMIGKKVTVYISHKRHERVLHEDKDGLYIRYKGQRVPCRPDTNSLNVLFFLALDPKIRKLIRA
jgi:hypothetical protein